MVGLIGNVFQMGVGLGGKVIGLGVGNGFQMGVNTMRSVLDEEWKDISLKKNSLSTEQ